MSIDDIHSFLDQANKTSLFEYLEVAPNASVDEMRGALQRRRQWAQAQQSNPKHRAEARWLIRNFRSIESLIENPDEYRLAIRQKERERNLEDLRELISVTQELQLDASMLTLILYYAERKGIGMEKVESLLASIHGRFEVELLIDELLDPHSEGGSSKETEDMLEEDDWEEDDQQDGPPEDEAEDEDPDEGAVVDLAAYREEISASSSSIAMSVSELSQSGPFAGDHRSGPGPHEPAHITQLSDEDLWAALQKLWITMGLAPEMWTAIQNGRVPRPLIDQLLRMGKLNGLPLIVVVDMLRDAAEQHLR